MTTAPASAVQGAIWGIDPGTHCGWSVRDNNGRHQSGVWDLSPKRHEGAGMRLVRLRGYLNDLLRSCGKPGMIAYEEVRRHAGTTAAHVYGEITGRIREFCEDEKIPYTGIPVGTVKKKATGKGNAGKEAMVGAACAKWGVGIIEDDNEADARWIAESAAEQFSPA